MVKINIEGRGRSIQEATADLYACLQGEAEERGLPVTVDVPAQQYLVSIRPEHGKYVSGKAHPDLHQALNSAYDAVGIKPIDPKTQYLRIQATYDLTYDLRKGDTPTPTRTGQPSGAAPSERRGRRDITKFF